MIARREFKWGLSVATYRLYRLDGAGRISGAEWIETADDGEARTQARSRCSPGRYELWERYRMVERAGARD